MPDLDDDTVALRIGSITTLRQRQIALPNRSYSQCNGIIVKIRHILRTNRTQAGEEEYRSLTKSELILRIGSIRKGNLSLAKGSKERERQIGMLATDGE
jgi:hypothetical protein